MCGKSGILETINKYQRGVMDEESGEWSDLDQISFRKSIKEIIRDLPDDAYQARLTALSQLRSIVMDEVAKGFYMPFLGLMQHCPKETAAQARVIVDRAAKDLGTLGLAVKHPETSEPMRLTLAKTPPRDENEGWLMLEPMLAGTNTRPMRIPSPTPFLYLCEAPLPITGIGKDLPRR